MTLHKKMGVPITQIQLNHPADFPIYEKVRQFERHPSDGPPILLISGGSGARALSKNLIRFTHNSVHVLPVFDDGGSSRELRKHFKMPPPGDLRNRLMSLSDMSKSGNPEVSRLFQTRLPHDTSPQELEAQLNEYLAEDHPQFKRIEVRYRKIIINHLKRFAQQKPADFDLRGGSLGNFVIAGAYLSVEDLESVIFEFSALAAVRGQVFSVCQGSDYHLKATFDNGDTLVGQSLITSQKNPPITKLSIVSQEGKKWKEARPTLNPLVKKAIHDTALITFTMGSLYTSLLSNLLVQGMGEEIRKAKKPKVFIANLVADEETPNTSVSKMLKELHRYLQASDHNPGALKDYVHYVLVGDHGNHDDNDRIPVDVEEIRALGVEPIILPLAKEEDGQTVHDVELVSAVLLSLC